jgi:hypothetical protein
MEELEVTVDVIDPPAAVAVYKATLVLDAVLSSCFCVQVGPPEILVIGLLPVSSATAHPTNMVPAAGEYDGVVLVVEASIVPQSCGEFDWVMVEYVGAAMTNLASRQTCRFVN